MAESFEGGLVMGLAQKTNQPGRVFHMLKDRRATWHHDWRGSLALSGIYAGLIASGGAIAWSLWHISMHAIR